MSTQTNKNSKMISKNQCVSVNVTDFYDPDLIETSQTSHSGETHHVLNKHTLCKTDRIFDQKKPFKCTLNWTNMDRDEAARIDISQYV